MHGNRLIFVMVNPKLFLVLTYSIYTSLWALVASALGSNHSQTLRHRRTQTVEAGAVRCKRAPAGFEPLTVLLQNEAALTVARVISQKCLDFFVCSEEVEEAPGFLLLIQYME